MAKRDTACQNNHVCFIIPSNCMKSDIVIGPFLLPNSCFVPFDILPFKEEFEWTLYNSCVQQYIINIPCLTCVLNPKYTIKVTCVLANISTL